MDPLIIEVSLNGSTKRARNPNLPVTPDEIVEDSLRCIDAGAAIVHYHIEDLTLTGEVAAARYLDAWKRILAHDPDALLITTIPKGDTVQDRWSHAEIMARQVPLRIGPVDPGTLNLPGRGSGPDGLPGPNNLVYANTYDEIRYVVERCMAMKAMPTMGIYDATFLRAALAYEQAGMLPYGCFVQLYFGGDHSMSDGVKGAMSFGFKPTKKALEAYVEMLEGSRMTWVANVVGGDITACGMTRWAIEAGGHVRVGLEDYAGDRTPTNLELIEEVKAIAREVGRPIADAKTAAEIFGMPPLEDVVKAQQS